MSLPLHLISIDATSSNAAYEAAFHRSLGALGETDPTVRHLAFGDLFLADVRAYRELLLLGTGFEAMFPLWGQDTSLLAARFIDEGYRARLVCVDTTQLDGVFVGRAFDHELLRALPAGVDPCGERGEFHTFVSDGPIFASTIAYEVGEIVLRDQRFAYCDLAPGAEAAGSGS